MSYRIAITTRAAPAAALCPPIFQTIPEAEAYGRYLQRRYPDRGFAFEVQHSRHQPNARMSHGKLVILTTLEA